MQPADLGPGDDHPAQAPAGELAGERGRGGGRPATCRTRGPVSRQTVAGSEAGSGRPMVQLGAAGRGDHPAAGRGELDEDQAAAPSAGRATAEQPA